MNRLYNNKKKIKNFQKYNRLIYFFLLSEYVYNSLYLTKLINNIMKKGKKDLAQKKMYYVMKVIKKNLHKNPEIFLYDLHIKMLPFIKINVIKKAKRTYQIPVIVGDLDARMAAERKMFILVIRQIKGASFEIKMLREIYAIIYDETLSNYIALHNKIICDGIVNRIYSHYRF